MKIIIPVEFDDTDLWSMVCGSAWETWAWWRGWRYEGGDWDKPCQLWILVENPWTDDLGETFSAVVTIDDIARAMSELTDHTQVMRCLLNDDFDAIYGDVVMQQAVFGEVIYG